MVNPGEDVENITVINYLVFSELLLYLILARNCALGLSRVRPLEELYIADRERGLPIHPSTATTTHKTNIVSDTCV